MHGVKKAVKMLNCWLLQKIISKAVETNVADALDKCAATTSPSYLSFLIGMFPSSPCGPVLSAKSVKHAKSYTTLAFDHRLLMSRTIKRLNINANEKYKPSHPAWIPKLKKMNFGTVIIFGIAAVSANLRNYYGKHRLQ